jgi:hypothetical protein
MAGLTILKKLEDLVRDIAIAHNIPLHKIEAGVIHQKQPGGAGLELPVIRVTSYLDNAATELATALNTELDIARILPDVNNKAWCDQSDGNAIQYLASLRPDRAALLEYRGLNNRKFTIEVRSMIQDTWMGLERHLGYDNTDLSDTVRRELFRVSTLLEMADKELQRLNQSNGHTATTSDNIPTIAAAEAYTSAAITVAGAATSPDDKRPKTTPPAVTVMAPKKADAEEQVKESPAATPAAEVKEPEGTYIITPAPSSTNGNHYQVNGNGHAVNGNSEHHHANGNGHTPAVPETAHVHAGHSLYENIVDDQAVLTYASLREFVKSSAALKEIDMRIAAQAGAKLNDDIDIDGDMERLNFLQIYTLKQLHEKIAANKQEMVAFAEKWIGRDNGGSFDSGIGLFYLEYVLVAERNDTTFATEYVLKFIADNDYSARYIIPTYTSIKSTEKPHTYAQVSVKK